MNSTTYVAELAECVRPLDEDGRRAVRRYWEQVIWEEWVRSVRPARRAVSLAELDGRRERRQARRAVARIAAAGRLAPVVALRSGSVGVAGGRVVAGEAA